MSPAHNTLIIVVQYPSARYLHRHAQDNLVIHPFGVDKLSTSFGRGYGVNVISGSPGPVVLRQLWEYGYNVADECDST